MLVLEELGLNGLKIYQDDELYRFTSDAVILSKFATVKANDVVADFCSGSGIVGLHLYALNPKAVKKVTLIEMQKPLYELSLKSIGINGLKDVFDAVNVKVQELGEEYNEKFSLIVCNPPYMEKDGGAQDENPHKALCRREIALSLKELISKASKCLKYGGRLAVCHRADRLADLFCEMRANNIEPKRLQPVCAGEKKPYLVTVEGVKGGKKGLDFMSPLEN